MEIYEFVIYYLFFGLVFSLLIYYFPEKFQTIIVDAIATLKATSLRSKYSKEWNEDLENELAENINQYKKSLKTKSFKNDPNNIRAIVIYFSLWIFLLFIIGLAFFFKFFEIYQSKIKNTDGDESDDK